MPVDRDSTFAASRFLMREDLERWPELRDGMRYDCVAHTRYTDP